MIYYLRVIEKEIIKTISYYSPKIHQRPDKVGNKKGELS